MQAPFRRHPELCHHHRVELRSRRDAQNFERDAVTKGAVLHAGDVNRFKGVGHGQNSRAEGNELSADAVGIAASIPPFVVMGDQNRRLPQEDERFKQIGAKPGMVLKGDVR